MRYVVYWLQFFAIPKLALGHAAIPARSWDWSKVSSDLSCSVDAVQLLTDGRETACRHDEWYEQKVNVGQCNSCNLSSRGPGFYCNGSVVMLCPTGFYCPNYLEKIVCPEGKWCRSGFVEPFDCHFTVTCPEGSEIQQAGWGFFIGTMWIFAAFSIPSCVVFMHSRRSEEEFNALLRRESMKTQEEFGVDFKQDEEEAQKVSISFERLSLCVKKTGKCVLKDVSGQFPSGSLVALMGPSGGGKTTFMNALCGRADYGYVTGDILINGRKGGVNDFPRLVGFVPQDDIMHCDLTVQQNLYFNALLRLPAAKPYDYKASTVMGVLKALGLMKIKDSVVGNAAKRGISGGQKKRVNIGMELVAIPSIIFMDEPTSGLDGAATLELAQCLSNLSNSGLTIVCVIHQPRYAVFEKFSHLLLLGAGGQTCFCGERHEMEKYFTDMYFRCPPKENPADWMIDIVSSLSPKYLGEKGEEIDKTFKAPDDLFKMWREREKHVTAGENDSANGKELKDRVTPNTLKQIWIFLKRCFRQYSMLTASLSNGVLFLCGMIFGRILTSLMDFSYSSIMGFIAGNHRILFYMICTIKARSVFGYERLEYIREFRSGTSCIAYWSAKQIWNCIDWHLYTLSFSLPLYYLMPIPAQNYYKFFLAYQWAAYYHLGLGMLFSVCIVTPTTSVLACVFTPLMMELAFSGSLVSVQEMGGLQKALSWFSCGRWFRQTLYINEIRRFPEHTHNFTEVTLQFERIDSSLDDNQEGFWWIGFLGVFYRLLTLFVLLSEKHDWHNRVITSANRLFASQCGSRSSKKVEPITDVQPIADVTPFKKDEDTKVVALAGP